FVMCATAAPISALSPLFQKVAVSLDISASASSIAHDYNMLLIEFSSSNNSTNVVDSVLAKYAATLVTSAAPNSGYTIANASNVLTTILAASSGTVQIAVYIPPTTITGTSVSNADDLTSRVYSALTSGDCTTLASTNGSLSIKTTSLRQVFNASMIVQPAMACGSAAGVVKSGTTTYIIFMLVVLVLIAVLAAMSMRNEVPIRSANPGQNQETSMKPRTAHGDSVLVSPSPRKPDFEDDGLQHGSESIPQPDLTASPVKSKPDLFSPDRLGLGTRPARIDTPASPRPVVVVATQVEATLPPSITARAPAVIDFPVVASKSTVVSVDDRDPLHDDDSDDEYTHADF
ncbi:transmembrane protein, putative, partial [Bodo saltans]